MGTFLSKHNFRSYNKVSYLFFLICFEIKKQ